MTASRILDRLGKLPRAQRLMLFGLVYVLLIAAYVFVLYMPKGDELGELNGTNKELVAQRAQIEERIRNKAEFETEVLALTEELKRALKQLPDDREIPALLKDISTKGKKVGLEVKTFNPLSEVTREFVAEVPVALEVEGSFHEVAMFFDRLSKMNRIVYVQDLEMTSPDERGGKVYLSVSGKVTTFRFLTEDEIAAAAARTKDSGGKRGKRGKK